MHTETDYLKTLAVEIAAKTKHENTKPDQHLYEQAKLVQKIAINHLLSIDNFPQREIFYFNTLGKLVDTCDILFKIENTITPDVQVLLNLLTEIKKVIPSEISPKLQLPEAFILLQKEVVLNNCTTHLEEFKAQSIDPKLIAIAAIPFRQFANPSRKLYWRDFTWLKGYQEKLHTIDWDNADCNSKTEALTSVLLNYGFNDDRFFIYCKKYIVERTNKFGTKKRRLAEFVECEKLILQDAIDEFPLYNYRWPAVSTKLIEWIRLEVKALKENDCFDEQNYKIEFNLDGESLAIFWKHLMEHGITKLVPLDLYAKQIVATCSSKDTVQLKWTTIKSKFNLKTPKYLRRIFDPLVAILNDIKRFIKP